MREATTTLITLSNPLKKKRKKEEENPTIFQNKKEHKNKRGEATNIKKISY